MDKEMLNRLRKEYRHSAFDETTCHTNPFGQFRVWFADALQHIEEPNAMALATVGSDGIPSVRMVLLKQFDDTGFVFFTNYNSKKGRQLNENPKAALLFYWPELERQVRVEGSVEMLSASDSDVYFASRPPKSRVSAVISPQSSVIPSRQFLEEKFNDTLKQHSKELFRPSYWGGYLVKPVLFEFWQGREHRLHDRIQYRLSENGWITERLAP